MSTFEDGIALGQLVGIMQRDISALKQVTQKLSERVLDLEKLSNSLHDEIIKLKFELKELGS